MDASGTWRHCLAGAPDCGRAVMVQLRMSAAHKTLELTLQLPEAGLHGPAQHAATALACLFDRRDLVLHLLVGSAVAAAAALHGAVQGGSDCSELALMHVAEQQ